ncbi:hypothetical protein M514_09802 [Trichuris suis]|uniref:Uncharacterized protein n=1 Tax=Trichuris suis TaxID=68888 RepID=A0A085NL94_9BILA|nr:hypothetical protein M514_09802 [Trichuris suis]
MIPMYVNWQRVRRCITLRAAGTFLKLMKVLLSVCWCARRAIHQKILKLVEAITADVYCHELTIMLQSLQSFWPELAGRKAQLLPHDNARPFTADEAPKVLEEFGNSASTSSSALSGPIA